MEGMNMQGKMEKNTVESSTSTKKVEEMFKEYPLHSAPYDKDGFIKSFKVDDVDGFKKFFDEYGFVVVDGILNEEEIKETLNEVWDTLEHTKWGPKMEKINRNDPTTWEDDRWPMAVRSLGILGHDAAATKRAWMNRQNENLYKVFSVLMNKKELWASVDRYGIMRPTKNVPIGKRNGDGTRELEDRPAWKTVPAWLHWDLNPYKWIGAQEGIEYEFEDFITENNGSKNDGLLKLQGLVALTESRDEDGGFCTVSGFHKHLAEWCKLTADTDFAKRTKNTFDFVSAPKGDPMFQQIQNITCRAGSLIVWRGEQPHCNYPNNSNRFRINQYIKCFPAQPKGKGVALRKSVIQNMIPKEVKVTKLGKKLFGLKDW